MLKRRKFTPTERAFVEFRALGCCEYCKIPHDFSPDTFNVEHIISLYEGGTNELINLAFSCGGCNNRKGQKITAKDPISGILIALFNPRTDNWQDHFQWQDNFSTVGGLTSQGRATAELLQLNRKGIINLRKALLAYGVYPVS